MLNGFQSSYLADLEDNKGLPLLRYLCSRVLISLWQYRHITGFGIAINMDAAETLLPANPSWLHVVARSWRWEYGGGSASASSTEGAVPEP